MDAMIKQLASSLLILLLSLSMSSADNGYPCNCEDEGFWSMELILDCQRVSDFLIAFAYFSIPVELLFFVSCSDIPFKWVLFQFIAFIVLCGMTHLLNGWAYGPHGFELLLALTIFKLLTALVSFATAITLVTLIPLLLKVKVREFMLRKKTWDLNREVGFIRKQNEAGLHVRMLTQEIRKSLDRHTILYTTLVELSKTLDLQNCVIWMPNADRTEMRLTHELRERNFCNTNKPPIPTSDVDVREIKASDRVKILNPDSTLAVASSEGFCEPGSVAAIRMPMLKVSNFKGGTPVIIPSCYAILVLVLPNGHGRLWSNHELEIVEVVADQVAVALSHASVLEESQLMREKLAEQNRALEQANQNALRASQARSEFQTVMSNGLRKPMHSILGLLSMFQAENLSNEQRLLVDTIVKTSNVLATLVTDVMDTSVKDNGRFPLELKPFDLHSMIKEAACLSKCLCAYNGYGFVVEVDKSLRNYVMGDERRVFQAILHMVGNLLNVSKEGGCLILRVFPVHGSQDWTGQKWAQRKSNSVDGHVFIRFEVGLSNRDSTVDDNKLPVIPYGGHRYYGGVEEGMSFRAIRKLVQLMQGDIWMTSNPEGFDQSIALLMQFQARPSIITALSRDSSILIQSNSIFRGIKVILADSDDINRAVTKKLLERLGCIVTDVSTGYDCLKAINPSTTTRQIVVLLDLHLADIDSFEVALRIRKFRSRSWPLIFALTTSEDGETRERCLQMGMNGVIQIPSSFQEIAFKLRRVLMQPNRNISQ